MHWKATAVWDAFGADTGLVTATVEYSLDGGGSWSTLETYSWTASSPACPTPSDETIVCGDHVAQLALSDYQHTGDIQVRATVTAQMTHCDNCDLRISNVLGQIAVYDIRVVVDNCQIPTSESSNSEGWGLAYPFRTTHDFEQSLTPAGDNNFSGRLIREADPVPGGGATDTCWFSGSMYDKVTSVVSGGSWHVQSLADSWGDPEVDMHPWDTVGWLEGPVNYYRTYGQTFPCYVQGPQRMEISCQSSTQFVPYILNTLNDGIDSATVSSTRQSNVQQRDWP